MFSLFSTKSFTLVFHRSIGVDIVTLGQYLRPSKAHMQVARYAPPAEFDHWREVGEALGFAYVASGPLVRSSYRAGELFVKSMLGERRGLKQK